MKVSELNQDQYKELCQHYISNFWSDSTEGSTSPSYYELACADELVDRTIIENYYAGINFVEEDFSY